jgi:hypothetical protein
MQTKSCDEPRTISLVKLEKINDAALHMPSRTELMRMANSTTSKLILRK